MQEGREVRRTASDSHKLHPCPECGFGLVSGAEWCPDCGLETAPPRVGFWQRLQGTTPAPRHRSGGLRGQELRITELLTRAEADLALFTPRLTLLRARIEEARTLGSSLADLETASLALEKGVAQREWLRRECREARANLALDRLENRLHLLLDNPGLAPAVDPLVPRGVPLKGHTRAVASVAFSPDGRTLAVGGLPTIPRVAIVIPRIVLRHPSRAQTQEVWEPPDLLAFSPDGRTLVSGSSHETVKLWDIATARPRGTTLVSPRAAVVGGAFFSPDGRKLGPCRHGDGFTLRIGICQCWDVAAHRPRKVQQYGVRLKEISADGRTLAVGSIEGMVELVDAATGQPRGAPLVGHTGPVLSAAFAPDGRTLASGSSDGTVRLWDVLFTIPAGAEAAHALASLRQVTDEGNTGGVRQRAVAAVSLAVEVCARLTVAEVERRTGYAAPAARGTAEALLSDLMALAAEAQRHGNADASETVAMSQGLLVALPARALAPMVNELTARAETGLRNLGRATSTERDHRLQAFQRLTGEITNVLARWEGLPEATRSCPFGLQVRATLDDLAHRLPELEDLVLARQAVADVAGVQPNEDSEALRHLREQREALESALSGPDPYARLKYHRLTAAGAEGTDGFMTAQPDLAARAEAIDAIEAEYIRPQAESEVLGEA